MIKNLCPKDKRCRSPRGLLYLFGVLVQTGYHATGSKFYIIDSLTCSNLDDNRNFFGDTSTIQELGETPSSGKSQKKDINVCMNMLITVWFTIAKKNIWQQPECSTQVEWLSKWENVNSVEHHVVIKVLIMKSRSWKMFLK